MLVSQYTYFALTSTWMPAAEITARLGIEPDEVTVRGSRLLDPPRPVAYSWRVVCRTPGLTVDEQMERIIARLSGHAERIGALAVELERVEGESGGSRMHVVRRFEHRGDQDEDLTGPGDEGPAGQSRLLGWHLDARALEFLRLTHADLDVDEYAYADE